MTKHLRLILLQIKMLYVSSYQQCLQTHPGETLGRDFPRGRGARRVPPALGARLTQTAARAAVCAKPPLAVAPVSGLAPATQLFL